MCWGLRTGGKSCVVYKCQVPSCAPDNWARQSQVITSRYINPSKRCGVGIRAGVAGVGNGRVKPKTMTAVGAGIHRAELAVLLVRETGDVAIHVHRTI